MQTDVVLICGFGLIWMGSENAEFGLDRFWACSVWIRSVLNPLSVEALSMHHVYRLWDRLRWTGWVQVLSMLSVDQKGSEHTHCGGSELSVDWVVFGYAYCRINWFCLYKCRLGMWFWACAYCCGLASLVLCMSCAALSSSKQAQCWLSWFWFWAAQHGLSWFKAWSVQVCQVPSTIALAVLVLLLRMFSEGSRWIPETQSQCVLKAYRSRNCW